MSKVIQTKINAVRRKHAGVRAGEAACLMASIVVGVLGVTMLIDWLFDLPYLVRAALLSLHAATLMYILVRFVIWPLIKGPDDETVALWIERLYPESASRIISAVQFSRVELVGMSPAMANACVAEAEEFIQPRECGEAVATDVLLKRLGIAMLVGVLGIGLLLWGGQNARDLLLRALAVPGIEVPRKTRVELITPPKLVVAKGDTIKIEAYARGIIPDDGTLRVEYANKATAEFLMKADPTDSARFLIDIDNVQDGFTYRVLLNDGKSVEATVEAHARPAVASVDVQQYFPAYTKLQPAKRSTGDLTLLAGSRLGLRVIANKPVANTDAVAQKHNRVKFEGSNVSYPLKRDASDPKVLYAADGSQNTIPLPEKATGMSVYLVDDLGLESKDPAVYRVEVIPDTAPQVKITYPEQREELVTERAKATVGFEMSDDFGVAKARIRYMPIGGGAKLEGDGLSASYFKNKDMEGEPAAQRVEPKIDLNYDKNPVPGLPADNFSARFTGKVVPPVEGSYEFSVESDDGCRLWIGDTLILDKWGDGVVKQKAAPVMLEAGKLVDIKIEYMEATGDASFKLNWLRPDKHSEGGQSMTRYLFSGEEAILKAREKLTKSIDLAITPDRTIRGQYPWALDSLKLSPGEGVEWWVEAEDANDQTGPGRTESEHRTIRIGTEAQVREYLLARLGNYLQAIHDVRDSQLEETQRLGQIILEKSKIGDQQDKP